MAEGVHVQLGSVISVVLVFAVLAFIVGSSFRVWRAASDAQGGARWRLCLFWGLRVGLALAGAMLASDLVEAALADALATIMWPLEAFTTAVAILSGLVLGALLADSFRTRHGRNSGGSS